MTSKTLKPILGDISELKTFSGRYSVQLEIPRTSTLTANDIEKILRISSWDLNPNKAAEGFEGTRSILLRKDDPITIGKIELPILQLSGIGHRGPDLKKIPGGKKLYPPSSDNFMDRFSGLDMCTGHAEGTNVINERPGYRALGTYTYAELKEKLTKTQKISSIPFEDMTIPHVEAYGRYLDKGLQNKEGHFGFMVFPVPARQRAREDFLDKFIDSSRGLINYGDMVTCFLQAASPYLTSTAKALRELHDNARIVHLQTHLDNFYLVNGRVCLVDWATSRKLSKNDTAANLMNRTIDLRRPMENFSTIFSRFFSEPNMCSMATILVSEKAMHSYSGQQRPVDYFSLAEQVGPDGTEHDLFMLWMRQQGIESRRKGI